MSVVLEVLSIQETEVEERCLTCSVWLALAFICIKTNDLQKFDQLARPLTDRATNEDSLLKMQELDSKKGYEMKRDALSIKWCILIYVFGFGSLNMKGLSFFLYVALVKSGSVAPFITTLN